MEDEVFSVRANEQDALFVVRLWTTLINWATMLLNEARKVDNTYGSEESAALAYHTAWTASDFLNRSIRFQTRAPYWTVGELYEELFNVQETIIPELGRLHLLLGEWGIDVLSKNGMPAHEHLAQIIKEKMG